MELQELEKKVAHLKAFLKTDDRKTILPRPLLVEFTGSPSSGKTTIIGALDTLFRSAGLSVWTPQEGAEVIRHIPRTTPAYNVRTGVYALGNILDMVHTRHYDIVLFDRGVFDAYTWMTYWHHKGHLSQEEMKMNQAFFLQNFWTEHMDAAYIITCEPKEALHREGTETIAIGKRSTTTVEGITKLKNFFETTFTNLHAHHPQLTLIDTTFLTKQKMIMRVVDDIFEKIEHRLLLS